MKKYIYSNYSLKTSLYTKCIIQPSKYTFSNALIIKDYLNVKKIFAVCIHSNLHHYKVSIVWGQLILFIKQLTNFV